MTILRAACVSFVLLLAGLPSTGFAGSNYFIRDLGALIPTAGTVLDSSALGICYIDGPGSNDFIYVVGEYQTTLSSSMTAFLYRIKADQITEPSKGRFFDIGKVNDGASFSPTSNLALALSSDGRITGVEGNGLALNPFDAASYRAFRSSVGDPATSSVVSAGVNTEGFGINNTGKVAGQMDSGSTQHAFVATGSTITDLGHGGTSYAQGINDMANAQIIGQDTWSNQLQATVWTVNASGALLSETNLSAANANPSWAKGLNDSNVIVGYDSVLGIDHAVEWTLAGGVWTQSGLDLGKLDNPDSPDTIGFSHAFSVNTDGLVVGEYDYIFNGSHTTKSFIYNSSTNTLDGLAAGAAYDLASLIASNPFTVLSSAAFITELDIPAINNAIAGVGLVDGHNHAFLAWDPLDPTLNNGVPTPEPGTMALVGLGVLGAALLRKRMKTVPA